MTTLDRTAILLRPREPFLLWARATDDESGLADEVHGGMLEDPTVYLVQAFDEEASLETNLGRVFAALFEDALEGWSRDAREWPRERTYARFTEWFDVEVRTVVVDLASDGDPGEDA